MAFLTIQDLRKRYGIVNALDGIDLEVEPGEFVTLLGPSGSGKTTLLMAIGGFVMAEGGSIVLKDRDITRLEPEDRNLGLVFQGYALFPHMSVAQNIAFPLTIRRWDRRRIAGRVEEMLALVEMSALAQRRPRELSGGQQQRVALARALSFGPEILLLDEPLSALDRTLRDVMQRELKRLHRETGVTFLYVTHDQEEAIAMSDRIAVFQHGRIVQVGTPRQIYDRPASRFVAEFLGANNLLEGRVVAAGAGLGLEIFGSILPLEGRGGHRAGDVATAWVRPEHASLTAPAAPALELQTRVVDVSFLGAFDRLVLRLPDGPEFIIQTAAVPDRPVRPNDSVSLYLPQSAIGVLPSVNSALTDPPPPVSCPDRR